jgi:MioC protein
MEIKILVGTMTGTAEMVGKEVCGVLEGGECGCVGRVELMDGLDERAFEERVPYLICTSTYGNGDVPDNAQHLFESLETKRPDLSGLVYGVIALGDTTYSDTYCEGGKKFDRLLTELGAKRAGEIFFHDANSGTLPEEEAAKWIVPWIEEKLKPAMEKAKS